MASLDAPKRRYGLSSPSISPETSQLGQLPKAILTGNEYQQLQSEEDEDTHVWILARKSRIPEWAWNSQSVMILGGFESFESPHHCNTRMAIEDESKPGKADFFQRSTICETRPSSVSSEKYLLSSQASLDEKYRSERTDSMSSTDSELEPPKKILQDEPYHIFTRARKMQIIYIVSAAALFSPLSSNIYFPAMGQISKDLNVSIESLGFTITVYMVVQGIAPSFWGSLADTVGRRQVFIWTFFVYLIACVGLALSKNFLVLMIFRAVQAAGGASTISIGAGVIGDITTSKERGSLIGVFGGIRMMGQAVGPVFGGIISQYLGFRAIFWFLFILGSLSVVTIIVFLPETLRSIAGNGSVRLRGLNRPLVYAISPQKGVTAEFSGVTRGKVTLKSVVSPLVFLFEKDVFITLFSGAIIYTVWSMVTSSTTAIFQENFGLNDLQVGLAFLPNGAGCVLGSIITGYLMDHDYKKTEQEYLRDKGLAPDTELNKKELLDFPIERSRLRSTWWIITIFVITTALYGYSISLKMIALPLMLQFLIAYTATAVFSFNSALIIDLYPGASASATAVNNLMRCSVGAAGVGIIQFVIDALGVGHTFALFAGLAALTSQLLFLEWRFGEVWRCERSERLRRRKEAKEIGDLEKAGGA